LGMGSDGHVASIFEGQENVIFSGNIVEMAYNPENNQRRITLTPYCINNANKVAFQISGLVKANIIKEILNNGSKSHIYPAKQIKPSNGDLYWFLDSGAASGLIIKD